MRAQSSVEFLTTYSFLFIILGLILIVTTFLATAPTATIQSQCSAFGGPNCNFVEIYSNRTAGYSLFTFSMTNSQSVPINITNMTVQVRNLGSLGYCTPAFLYPGQESTCVVQINTALPKGTLTQGFYVANAFYCNSGISNVSHAKCNFERVQYGGAFQTSPLPTRVIVWSVVASQGPTNLQLLPFSALSTTVPLQPNNYTILQNSDWATNVTGGVTAFSYATNTPWIGTTYQGYKSGNFPSAISWLSSNNVACSSPYNSIFSIASTTLYFSSAASSQVSVEGGGAIEVFYKVGGLATVWQNVFTGNGWKTQNPTAYGPSPVSFSQGLYNVEVAWSNTCGGGVQVFKLTAIPA